MVASSASVSSRTERATRSVSLQPGTRSAGPLAQVVQLPKFQLSPPS